MCIFFTNDVYNPLTSLNDTHKIYFKDDINKQTSILEKYLTNVYIGSKNEKIIGKQFNLSNFDDLMYVFNKFPNLKNVDNACQTGCVKMLEWFWNRKNKIEFKYSNNAIAWASHGGHLHVIKCVETHLNIT